MRDTNHGSGITGSHFLFLESPEYFEGTTWLILYIPKNIFRKYSSGELVMYLGIEYTFSLTRR